MKEKNKGELIRDVNRLQKRLRELERPDADRRKADEALRESEERFRLLAENATDIIWTMDMKLRLTYVSPSVTRQRGYGVEEAIKQTIEEILTADSYKLAKEVFKEELMRKKSRRRDLNYSRILELEQRCKDGSTIWCEVNMTFLRDVKGKAVGILGVTRDITERRRVEEEYRMILNTSIDGFWITDIQGRFLDVNDAYCRLIGYNRGELLKMRISDIEAVERPGETYPLVVFCHGFGANYGVYTWLPEWMVPKGYVIAMIGLPDMLKFSIDLGVWQGAVTAAIDFALSENLRNNSAIYGMIDPTRVGAYGHSMGGATMFLATAHDRRIKATVSCSPPYFGTIWGEEVIGAARKVNVPMMVIVSNSDKITPPRGASTLYDAIDA